MIRSLFFIFFLLSLGACSGLKGLKLDKPVRQDALFKAKWVKDLDPYYLSGNLPITTGAPSIAEDILYVGTLAGEFKAIDADNGRVIWNEKDGLPISSQPLIDNKTVYYGGVSGRLYVRHYLTGKLKYAIDLGAPIESSPVLSQGRLLVYLRGHQIVCLDAETGKIIWNYRRAVPVTVTLQKVSRPLVLGNKIIAGFADGFLVALSLEEGTIVWEQKLVENQKFVDVDLNPILVNGMIISGSPSSFVRGVDPDTGNIKIQFTEMSVANPLIRGETMVLGTPEGEVVFMNLTGEVLKRKKVSKRPVNNLFWWREKLVVTTFKGELLALDPLSLKVEEKFLLGSEQSAVFGDLIGDENGFGMLTSRNRLYFFH